MEKMTLEQMSAIGGGKFWGSAQVVRDLPNGCTITCTQNYMFWIPVGEPYGCSSVCGPQF